MSVVRTRARLLVSALACLLAAAVLSLLPADPAAADPPGNPAPSGVQTGIPTFTWDRVPGATTYDFQIATSDTFGAPLVNVTTVQHQYVPRIELPTNVTLYWRVRATGAGEAWATASFSRSTVGPPNVTGPATGAELTQPDEPVVLSWEPVAGAAGYEVQYGTDPNFVDQTTTKSTASSSFVVPLQAVGTYQWRVRGVLANGVYTGYSGARTYVVKGLANDPGVPPTFPPDDPNYGIGDVVLDWEPIKGAKTYQLQISTDQLFNTIIDQQAAVYGTRYSPTKTLGNDQYYWRVRATDAGGFQPDWASRPTWRFKRSWPDQTTLGDGTGPGYPVIAGTDFMTVGDPFYYQWGPVEHASHYEVQLSSSPSFSSFSSCLTVHTTLVYGDGQACWPGAQGSYYWRVVAHDEFSAAKPHTDEIVAPVGRFTYDPGLVTMTGPPSGSSFTHPGDPTPVGKQPVLAWAAKAGAEKYQVTITGPTSKTVTTAALSYTPRDLKAGLYRWEVRSIDRQGAMGAGLTLGSQRTFTVSDVPMEPNDNGDMVPIPTPSPLPGSGPPTPNPVNVGDSYRFPTLRWNPVSYVASYTIYVRRQGTVGWQAIPELFRYAAGEDIRSTFLDPGTYEWYVEAKRVDNAVLAGSTGTFTILQLPDVAGDSYRASLTGNAMTGNAETPLDTCNAGLPATCQNLRQTPVLGWDSPDPNVGYYKLVLSRDAELTNQIETKSIANTMYLDEDALPDSQAGSAYFWLVVPCSADGHCSPLTHATHAFNKLSRPQTLTSPAHEAEVQNDVTLSWDDYLDSQALPDDLDTPLSTPGQIEAEYYRVQTASDQNFTQNVATASVDQRTFTAYADTYPEGTTWWRVQPVDETGNLLAWSTPRSFVKRSPVPTLLLPENNMPAPGDSTLSWAAQPFAASYDVEVYKGGDTSGNTVNRVVNENTDRIRFVLNNLNPAAGPYAWRVRRKDAKGRPGDWSAFRTFSVTTPGVPDMFPADNASVEPSDELFRWGMVERATTYKFERRPVNGSVAEAVTTPTTKWAPTSSLPGGDWQWRVTAYDAAGNPIADSTWSHPFSVVDTPVATSAVSISGAGTVDSTLTLNPASWNMPNDALSITYQWYRSGLAVAGETGLTYDVTSADVGKAITVRATATRPGYKTGTSTSNVINGTLAGAPVASVPAAISGTGEFGSTLTLTPPQWDTEGVTTSVTWYRDATRINGQTGPTYVVTTTDLGKTITARVTATKTGYAEGMSTSNGILASAAPAVTPTTAPSVSGVAAARETLTADPGTWPSGMTYTYQWFVDGLAVAKETRSTYVVRTRDAGLPISVRVTANKSGYLPGSASSAAVTAARLSTTTTASLESATVRKRARGVILVIVDIVDLGVPLGKVQVKRGTKVIGTVNLRNDTEGELKIRLKKLPPGLHKLKVFYLGSTATEPSKSKRLKLRVLAK